MKVGLVLGAAALATMTPLLPAGAQTTGTVTVQASADLYRYAPSLDGTSGSSLDGTDPVVINLGSAISITFSVVANGVTVNHGSGDTPNDADGNGNSHVETNTGYGAFSSIKAPTAGFLAGVIQPAVDLRATQQTGLDFTTGSGIDFTSLSPLGDQVFFIGDGTNSTGLTQTFNIPVTKGVAKAGPVLILGLTDACSYAGGPGCYSDNLGTFTVNYTLNGGTSAVPESATWVMMIAGFGMVGFALRRRIRASEAAFDQKIKRMTAGEIA